MPGPDLLAKAQFLDHRRPACKAGVARDDVLRIEKLEFLNRRIEPSHRALIARPGVAQQRFGLFAKKLKIVRAERRRWGRWIGHADLLS